MGILLIIYRIYLLEVKAGISQLPKDVKEVRTADLNKIGSVTKR